MSSIIQHIQQAASKAMKALYDVDIAAESIVIQETKKEFEGDFTLVVFPFARYRLGKPEQIGTSLGGLLVETVAEIESFNVIKGFLNLGLKADWWVQFISSAMSDEDYFQTKAGEGQTVVVEYCSPNTNKPLHLGHLRNIILGYSLTQILAANGYNSIPTCLFNDRGTNISKSMHAWLQSGKQETPETAEVKGDKLVGKYYVDYSLQLAKEVGELMQQGMSKEEATKAAPSTKAIQDMLIKWENGDKEVRSLWKTMNNWVYEAYEDTFKRLGVSFQRFYYESEVYQRGRETVEEGLEMGIFYKDDKGSVVVDNSDVKLDKKVLLRSNGTSLYITQDLAIAADKYNEFHMDKSIYVVGDEQNYHFQVLFAVLKKLQKPYAEGLFHLSYGMVDLPSGKMKSREGTTVDVDDLVEEVKQKAKEETQKLGKTEGMTESELDQLYETLGLGALKYYLAKVDPKKRMLFNPAESVDLHGHTGPFIQSSYTRTASLQRKRAELELPAFHPDLPLEDALNDGERALIKRLFQYSSVLQEAAAGYNPSLIANYAYELAREFNRFYHGPKILQAEKPNSSAFRFALSEFAGKAMKESMALLGIEMPSRM